MVDWLLGLYEFVANLLQLNFVGGNIYHNKRKKVFNFFITYFLVSHFWVIKKCILSNTIIDHSDTV